MSGAYLPNLEPFIQAGIDTKTGLPIKVTGSDKKALKQAIKAQLRVKEENEFVNRFTWYNLPCNISSAELERMLYYKGQLCFFYFKELNEFYFMPYTLKSNLDFYGRYNHIVPIPYTPGKNDDSKKETQLEQLSAKKLRVVYGLKTNLKFEDLTDSAVIIRDYTNQTSQTIIPRQILNDNILDTMAECIPLMRTRLILGTGVKGVRVNDADQARSVEDGARALENAAMVGDAYVPIVGNIEFQELTDSTASNSEEYMMAYQSLDNFRKETIGLPGNGVYEKKAHMLASEQALNGSNVDLVLQDALQCRQNFCNIVNSIWGIGIWCDISESISQADVNGDGVVYDENNGEKNGKEMGEQENDSTI